MKQIDKIDLRIWPFKLSVEGDRAVTAIRWPLSVILIAVAVAIIHILVRT